MSPQVSVVLPTYNRASTLGVAIHSVLSQRGIELELIVVDDGSTDATPDVLEQFCEDPRLRVVRHGTPRGVSAARNAGIALARGEYVAFQDSDDEWLADKLRRQLRCFDTLGSSCVLVGGTLLRHLGSATITCSWPLIPASAPSSDWGWVNTRTLIESCSTFVQTAIVRRSALIAVGAFDESLPVCEDFELSLRLLGHGRLAALSAPTVLSFESPNNLSSRFELRHVALRRITEKHAVLLREYPVAMAMLKYEIGKYLCLDGEGAQGRRFARSAIASRPGMLRPYLVWLASWGAGPAFQFLLRGYRALKVRVGAYR